MKRASGFYWIGFCLTGPDQRLSFQARIDPNNTTIAYWSKILREWQIAGDWEALKDGPPYHGLVRKVSSACAQANGGLVVALKRPAEVQKEWRLDG